MCESAATIRSPTWSLPSAGEPDWIVVTVKGPTSAGAGRLRAAAKSTMARRKFIATPAARTTIRIQMGLRLKAPAMARSMAASLMPRSRMRSASISPSSPSIFT